MDIDPIDTPFEDIEEFYNNLETPVPEPIIEDQPTPPSPLQSLVDRGCETPEELVVVGQSSVDNLPKPPKICRGSWTKATESREVIHKKNKKKSQPLLHLFS